MYNNSNASKNEHKDLFNNDQSNLHKADVINSSLLSPTLFNQEDDSLDPFAAILNPFSALNKEPHETQQESLPHFTDFVEMNLTRN